MSSVALSDSVEIRPRRFFEVLLPELLERRAAAATAIGGSISFVIHGEGSWVVHLGPGAPTVDEGIDLDADLVVAFSPTVFEDLLDGMPPDPDCLEPAAIGDGVLLEKFGRLILAPSRGGIAARLASF